MADKYKKTKVGDRTMYLYPPTGFTTPHLNKMMNHIEKREKRAAEAKAKKAAGKPAVKPTVPSASTAKKVGKAKES